MMQLHTLFSAFPAGFPGVGLLLLRLVVASTLGGHGFLCLLSSDRVTLAVLLSTALLVLSGVFLVIGFLTPILSLLRRLPVYPMFGDGRTRLQPVYVENVAEAITRALLQTESRAIAYECGGSHIYSYKRLLQALAEAVGSKAILLPLPFPAWQVMARVAEMLPNPPITRNQVELMQVDNVSATDRPGLADLGISPRAIEVEVRSILLGSE